MGAQCMRVVCTPTQPLPSCRPGIQGLELLGPGLFWTWYGSLACLSHTVDAKGRCFMLLIRATMHKIRAELLGSRALRQAKALLELAPQDGNVTRQGWPRRSDVWAGRSLSWYAR